MDRTSHWNHVYQVKAIESVSWYQETPQRSLDYIARYGERSARIIDVGGGASLLVDQLLNLGYSQLAVVDVSSVALNLAKIRLSERAPLVDWIVADLACRPLLPMAQVWHDRATLHFLNQPCEQQAYAQLAAETVAEGGHLILATFAPEGPDRCSGLLVKRHDIKSLKRLLEGGFELVEEDIEIHHTPAGHEQQFLWAVFRRMS